MAVHVQHRLVGVYQSCVICGVDAVVVQEIIKLVTVLGVMKMERRPYAVITATRSDTLPATAQQSPRTEMTSQVLGTRCNAVPESKTSLPIVS